jgi:hypothetical protein
MTLRKVKMDGWDGREYLRGKRVLNWPQSAFSNRDLILISKLKGVLKCGMERGRGKRRDMEDAEVEKAKRENVYIGIGSKLHLVEPRRMWETYLICSKQKRTVYHASGISCPFYHILLSKTRR